MSAPESGVGAGVGAGVVVAAVAGVVVVACVGQRLGLLVLNARSAVVEGLFVEGLLAEGLLVLVLVRIVFPLALALVFAIALANLINFLVVVVRASPMERQRKTKQVPDNHQPTRAQ